MMVAVQGLGRMDVDLSHRDREFLALSDSESLRYQAENEFDLADRFTLSYLWVLGAYELVRALDERATISTTTFSDSQRSKLLEAKRRFERIRMPLAKFEPSRRHRATDSRVAFPVMHQSKGISWRVAPDAYVTREDLSHELRVLLGELSARGA